MLDISLVRERSDEVRDALRRRFREDLIPVLDGLIDIDGRWRRLTTELRDLRRERNVRSRAISRMSGEEKEEAVREMRSLVETIRSKEGELSRLEGERTRSMLLLPNIPHPDVPEGEDESRNRVIRECGAIREFTFPPKDHIDLGLRLGLMDIGRAAKTSGARFYYLLGDLVRLEYSLITYTLERLEGMGFTLVLPPMLMRERAFLGTGFLPSGREDLYKVEGEDLFLVGTAEVALGAMHMDETFEEGDLPLHYGGISSCFRTEAGAHGRDTKGIFRVHQFEKVEMFKFAHPERSWDEHLSLLASAEDIVRSLDLPYRVVDVCTGELGASAARKYDIEIWLPGQGKYRECVSCSNCTDFQARRLNIRFRERGSNRTRFVHTLNSTAMASTRMLVAIMENYQNEDGTISVPGPLVPLMGREVIGKG